MNRYLILIDFKIFKEVVSSFLLICRKVYFTAVIQQRMLLIKMFTKDDLPDGYEQVGKFSTTCHGL
jgi:hypothetical protein